MSLRNYLRPGHPAEMEQLLVEKGYAKQTFFYQIGGGEDEDDTTIFVKGDKVIFYEYSRDLWRKCSYSEINYIEGLPGDADLLTDLDEL